MARRLRPERGPKHRTRPVLRLRDDTDCINRNRSDLVAMLLALGYSSVLSVTTVILLDVCGHFDTTLMSRASVYLFLSTNRGEESPDCCVSPESSDTCFDCQPLSNLLQPKESHLRANHSIMRSSKQQRRIRAASGTLSSLSFEMLVLSLGAYLGSGGVLSQHSGNPFPTQGLLSAGE